jgi:hypothetical protein
VIFFVFTWKLFSICRVPIPVEKCSFSESLDWREGGEEIRQYMQERVHLDWALGEGEDR